MVDSVNISTGHVGESLENARMFQHGAHTDGWVVPSDQEMMADVRSELSAGPYDAFDSTVSDSSLDVTIGSGEAFVGGTLLARDTTTTITLGTNVTDVTIYVGWAHQAKDTVVIGRDSDFTTDDPRIPLWTFETDSSGVTSAVDERTVGAAVDVKNTRYEGGEGAKVDLARSADEIDGIPSGAVMRKDRDQLFEGQLAFNRWGLNGALGDGDGEAIRFAGFASDATINLQGGHGRMLWAWNAYWDDTEGGDGVWRSVVGDELHACIGLVNNHPGYDTTPASIVFGSAPRNDSAGDPITWNWSGFSQSGDFDLNGNEIRGFRVEPRDNRPSDPGVGRMIFRTDRL